MKALKLIGSKVWVALCVGVMAVALAIVCSGTAFAQDFYVSCTVDDGTGEVQTGEMHFDIDNLYQDGDAVYGMYYKSGEWNVLATTHYATFEGVVNAALSGYNEEEGTNYTYENLVWPSSGEMSLYVADNGGEIYTKYYPTIADMTLCNGFYGKATNSDTILTSPLRTYDNPAAVFTMTYGSDITLANETAGDAAARAVDNQTVADDALGPRLIMGCSDGMTTSDAMGKRYVYDILGIEL